MSVRDETVETLTMLEQTGVEPAEPGQVIYSDGRFRAMTASSVVTLSDLGLGSVMLTRGGGIMLLRDIQSVLLERGS